MKTAKMFLVATLVCLGIDGVGYAKVPDVQPVMDTTTNNTILVYSGIVNVPTSYFYYQPRDFYFQLKNINTAACPVDHHYIARAAISDTTASRHDYRVENDCGISGVAINSINISNINNGTMTLVLNAYTRQRGWEQSGLPGFQTQHYCWDASRGGNPYYYVQNDIDHVQVDVYCVPGAS